MLYPPLKAPASNVAFYPNCPGGYKRPWDLWGSGNIRVAVTSQTLALSIQWAGEWNPHRDRPSLTLRVSEGAAHYCAGRGSSKRCRHRDSWIPNPEISVASANCKEFRLGGWQRQNPFITETEMFLENGKEGSSMQCSVGS